MKQRGGFCWSERLQRWRAYLHIGNKQVWSCAKYRKNEKDQAERDLAAAIEIHCKEIRDAEISARANRSVALRHRPLRKRDVKRPVTIKVGRQRVWVRDPLESYIERCEGKWAFQLPRVNPETGEVVTERMSELYSDYAMARMHAMAHLAGIDFMPSAFQEYRELHTRIDALKKVMDFVAKRYILPVLGVKDTINVYGKHERYILGHRWQRVRRFKTVEEVGEDGVVTQKRIVARVFLRLVRDKEG